MGSEGPLPVIVHITGFKKFYGVDLNPTERIAVNLKFYLKKIGMPKGVVLGSCTVLETAGEGALSSLHRLLESALPKDENGPVDKSRIIWLHLGVNSGAMTFAIESQAFNEASFRCPDELGWQPQRVPIVPLDGDITRKRETTLPAAQIARALATKYYVTTSGDAGRFVCNYVYYHSLKFAEENGIKSLFVHVPLFCTIPEKIQMQFVVSLLELLPSIV